MLQGSGIFQNPHVLRKGDASPNRPSFQRGALPEFNTLITTHPSSRELINVAYTNTIPSMMAAATTKSHFHNGPDAAPAAKKQPVRPRPVTEAERAALEPFLEKLHYSAR